MAIGEAYGFCRRRYLVNIRLNKNNQQFFLFLACAERPLWPNVRINPRIAEQIDNGLVTSGK